MPHKRNPIGLENITGISRVIRGYITTAYEDVPYGMNVTFLTLQQNVLCCRM